MILMLYTEIGSQGEAIWPYSVKIGRAEELTRPFSCRPLGLLSSPGSNAVPTTVAHGLTKLSLLESRLSSWCYLQLSGRVGCFLLPNYRVLAPNHQLAPLPPHRCFFSLCPIMEVHRWLTSLHFISVKSGHPPSPSEQKKQRPVIASLARVCIFNHLSAFSRHPGDGFLRVAHFFCIFLSLDPSCRCWSQYIW